ncbi:MAG: sulfite exporter TauE/SafE family protein [Oligoflexales bacterium]|nr:sulfite exporter TauE/SafE family protein [Oligoflexales bacterium]
MVHLMLGVLGVITLLFGYFYVRDFPFKEAVKEKKILSRGFGIGLVTNFFDTLGIGSFAPTTSILKLTGQTPDRLIPGTLNVAHTIPIVFQAFVFISIVEVDIVTLTSLVAASVLGAYIGSGVISKVNEFAIRMVMGFALAIAAVIMLFSQLKMMPGGGDAIGLTGMKLAFGIVGNFILGALMTASIGLYAPCMAMVFMLGMSPKVAFPIMMGSCAFLMPLAGYRFIKEKAYDRKISLPISIGGIIGVYIAAFIVHSLPLDTLRWVVIAVISYTAVIMATSKSTAK